MLLKDLPADTRPREKLLAHGAAALADAELVALLLRTGTPGSSVLQLAQQVLDAFGGVVGLLHASPADLRRIKGLGPAKRAEIGAVAELARRALAQQIARRPALESPQQLKDFLRLQLGARTQEVFAAVFLDATHHLIRYEELFRGTLAQTSVYPREIVKRAIDLQAAAVIFAHNHPSGAAEPSRADELLTQRLKAALQLVDVRVIDHVVVGESDALSFAERGLI